MAIKKIFSVLSSIVLLLNYFLVFFFLYIGFSEYFDLPLWSGIFFNITFIWFIPEIPFYFGANNLHRPFSIVWQADVKDRFLFFASLLTVIILNFLEGYYLKEFGFRSVLAVFVTVVNYFIFITAINFLASSKFKQAFNEKYLKWH